MSETLKRSEEAYLEWGTARDQKGIKTIPNDLDGFLAGYDAGKAAALEWAAGQVKAAGCECAALRKTYRFSAPHHPSCPVALAAKIREGAP